MHLYSTVDDGQGQESGEDLLLAQIDAFREKAKTIQSLIQSKEKRVKELEEQVNDKEAEIAELQEELNAKLAEADSLRTDVEKQVDRILLSLKEDVSSMTADIKAQADANEEASKNIGTTLEEKLVAVTTTLDTMKSELSEKTHSESVHLYRLVQDLMRENDRSQELLDTSKEQYESLKKRTTILLVLLIISIIVGVAGALGSFGIIKIFF